MKQQVDKDIREREWVVPTHKGEERMGVFEGINN